MIGVSHGGGLNSHGTDAESFPSEQETDQLGQSIAMHMSEQGTHKFCLSIYLFLEYLEQSLESLQGETAQPLLTLTETETTFILSLDSSIVANDSKDLEGIKQENERYVEVNIAIHIYIIFMNINIPLAM